MAERGAEVGFEVAMLGSQHAQGLGGSLSVALYHLPFKASAATTRPGMAVNPVTNDDTENPMTLPFNW